MDAAHLYRLPPEEFVAARDVASKAAKAGGDAEAAKALSALRRPSVAAWLVNALVAEEPQVLQQLLDLGPALAQAQSAGQGDVLRELGAQRRALVGAVTDRAVALAGRPVTTAVRDEVAGTLEAGLSDPASADAVRSGRLVRALSYAGFGGVDLAGAVATAPERTRPTTPDPRSGTTRPVDEAGAARARRTAEAVAQAETAAHAAAGELDDAVRACERRATEATAAEQAAEQVRRLRDEARAALEQAEEAVASAEQQAVSAQEQAGAAVAAVQQAQAGEEQARQALDRLRRA